MVWDGVRRGWAVTLLVVACGPGGASSGADGGGSTTESTGGGDVGDDGAEEGAQESAAVTTAMSGAGDTAESDDGTDTGEACEDQWGPPPPFEPEPVRVHVENARSEAIFVVSHGGDGCTFSPVAVSQAETVLRTTLGGCDLRCFEGLGHDECGCDVDCAPPPLVRIEPGATYTYVWDAWIYDEDMLPNACLAEGLDCGEGLRCFVPRPLDGGAYTYGASAVTGAQGCSVNGAPAACECTDPSGWCLVEPTSWNDLGLEATGMLAGYPEGTDVFVTFE